MSFINTFKQQPVLLLLTLIYSAVFLFAGFDPVSRAVWFAEILPALLILVGIFFMASRFEFSTTALVLMFVWLILHTIGSKYTFADVPFDWFNHLIGSERNNFDRVAHFSIGFYAYPIAEYLIKTKKCSAPLAMAFGLFTLMSVAAGYEIVEWWYAAVAGGEEGIAFLGSQGDIWDAQKDMLCDTAGALSALLLMLIQRKSD
jgi:putative membrane protein